ncbi:MAG: M6 family metalloprotease domain-containing protein [Paludibacter sp.]|nr:M6 family metalloprotease domain-containing protein [Paludibacter sp.]
MIKRILLLVLCAFFYQIIFIPVFAVKAYPYPFKVSQPDGTKLTIRLKGDEFHHYKTTEDGYLLKTNSKGYLTYATMNSLGEVVESKYIAKDVINRSSSERLFLKTVDTSAAIQKLQSAPVKSGLMKGGLMKSKSTSTSSNLQRAYPLIGAPKSLVILVNFADTTFVTASPDSAFTHLLNKQGYSDNGGTGSARDYFVANSYDKFSPEFDVVGPYTLPRPMTYYGGNDSYGNDLNPVQMVVDACNLASSAGVDFSQYDTDKNGVIDNVFICYAGHNEAEGGPANSVWPHSWEVTQGSNYSGPVDSITFNGELLSHYACTSELKGAAGSNMCGIGTFCHEFGHVLGLPDYYDTSGAQPHTLDSWSIMDLGNYSNEGRTPPLYSAWDRFFLGWLAPQQESSPANLTLLPVFQGNSQPLNTNDQAFLFSATTHNLNGASPSPTEFFMTEYRKQTGWDTYLPAEGMCIWHIDYDQSAWNNDTPNNYAGPSQTAASHMRVYLQPLSGSTTTPGTAFTTGSFVPTAWTGTDINRAIVNITKTSDNITFSLMPPKISITGGFSGFSTALGTPTVSQNLIILAANLLNNLNISFQNSLNFEMKLSSDKIWSKSLSLTPASGSVNDTLQVRYNPTATGTQTDQLSIQSTGLTASNFNLNGSCTIGPNSPVITIGEIFSEINFYPTLLNNQNVKTINFKSLDATKDFNLVVTGQDASMFTVSVSAIAKNIANGGTNINITYTPTAIGSHTAALTISGGGLKQDNVVTLTGTGF